MEGHASMTSCHIEGSFRRKFLSECPVIFLTKLLQLSNCVLIKISCTHRPVCLLTLKVLRGGGGPFPKFAEKSVHVRAITTLL